MRYVIVWLHAKLSLSYVHVFMYSYMLCCINIFVYAGVYSYILCVYSYILCVWVTRCMSVCRCVAMVTLKIMLLLLVFYQVCSIQVD